MEKSAKPLHRFIRVLEVAASGAGKINKDSGVDLVAANSLYDDGCISGARGQYPAEPGRFLIQDLSITPKGAALLAEWSALIARTSKSGRFLAVAERLVWVLVGVAASLSGKFIESLLVNCT